MNAGGSFKDPTEEDEESGGNSPSGSKHSSKDESVSVTATEEEKNGHDKSAGGARGSEGSSAHHAERTSKEQTEKTGLARLLQFIGECINELKKIHWPDRQQVIKETMSVIVLVAIITACVLGFDFAIAKAVFEPLDKLARHLGGGIGVHH